MRDGVTYGDGDRPLAAAGTTAVNQPFKGPMAPRSRRTSTAHFKVRAILAAVLAENLRCGCSGSGLDPTTMVNGTAGAARYHIVPSAFSEGEVGDARGLPAPHALHRPSPTVAQCDHMVSLFPPETSDLWSKEWDSIDGEPAFEARGRCRVDGVRSRDPSRHPVRTTLTSVPLSLYASPDFHQSSTRGCMAAMSKRTLL